MSPELLVQGPRFHVSFDMTPRSMVSLLHTIGGLHASGTRRDDAPPTEGDGASRAKPWFQIKQARSGT